MPRYLHRIHRLTPILQQSRRKGAKLRCWRVSILRQRAHYLGTVQAPDERSAEAAAAAQFELDEEERKWLAVREQD